MDEVLVHAVLTKFYRLGALNNRHLFLIVLGAGTSKIKVPAESVLGKGPLPALQMVPRCCVFICPLFLTHSAERVSCGPSSSSYKDTSPITEALPCDLF